jgi:limonene-1,2-epoxide hydrolase
MNEVTFLNPAMTETERANADHVLAYFREWEGKFDPEAAFAAYFSDDARLRYEAGIQTPVPTDMSRWIVGPAEIAATNKAYVDMGFTAQAEIRTVFASGPLVIVERIDHCTVPGGADRAVRMIGVFMVINGTIVEWTDFYSNRNADGVGVD